ncbi:MAG: hypothetical protein JW751_09285 [Polyangiaceae bacterium]|nr:hypothetical protein [Polyangiaceae bacterium]
MLGMLQPGAVLAFETPDAAPIEVGLSSARDATSPERWLEEDSVALEDLGSVTVFARNADPSCEAAWFVHAYAVVPAFPGPAGTEGSTALARDTVAIVGWATEVTAVAFGAGSDNADLREPALALGPAEGTSLGALVLGEGGSAILEFASPIRDGDGADFAVFENGFSDGFLELGFVEVSTDGRTFVRFDSVYLGTKPLSAFDVHSPTLFDGLAGKYRQGFGTPFDLATLRAQPEVAIGAVDLERISYVRVVDIVGDGAATDSFGHPIYDPYPTTGTAGFDLDAVAVLHAAAR